MAPTLPTNAYHRHLLYKVINSRFNVGARSIKFKDYPRPIPRCPSHTRPLIKLIYTGSFCDYEDESEMSGNLWQPNNLVIVGH